MRWEVAIPAIATIQFGYLRVRPTWSGTDLRQVAAAAVVAALFLWACAYLPPFGRTWDWLKHFAIFNEIAREGWPPVNAATRTYLRYPLGYYMVPGLAAKLFGEAVLPAAVFVQTWLGLLLVLLLALQKIASARPLFFLVVFLLFGGLDLVGWYFIGPNRDLLSTKEWWASLALFAYEGPATLYLWVPQHALAGMLGLLIVLRDGRPRASIRLLGLLGAALLFWSPFAAIGVLPFGVAAWGRCWRSILAEPANLLSAVLIAVPVLIYLAPGTEEIPRGWNLHQRGFSAAIYLAFLLLEAGAFLLALRVAGGWKELRHPWVLIGVLTLLPLYRMGLYNDFTMRASIPALTLLALASAAVVSRIEGRRWIPLAICVGIGAAGSALEIVGRGREGYVVPREQSLRSGFLLTERDLFVQYNAPLPNWILRRSGPGSRNHQPDELAPAGQGISTR